MKREPQIGRMKRGEKEEPQITQMTQIEERRGEIPGSWVWTRIKDICFLINGRAFKPSEWAGKGLPIIRIQNLNNKNAKYNYCDFKVDKKYYISDGQLLFAWSGTPGTSFGAHIWENGKAVLNQHIFRVEIDEKYLNKIFIKYLINNDISKYIQKAHGTAGLAHITKGKFENTKISLPPLNEQHRIVDKIEELFTQLDAGVEALEKAKKQVKQYRQSVLKYAFEGKLTEKWREEHKAELESASVLLEKIKQERKKALGKKYKELPPVDASEFTELPEGWDWVRLGNCSYGVEYGTSKKSRKFGKIPVLRMGNIQKCFFDWSDLVYTDDEEEIRKYSLRVNDVLFNRTNSPELVGKTAIYLGEQPAIFAGYLIRINQLVFISAKFLNYFLNSYLARVYGNSVKTDGVNQSNINGTKLSNYPFPLCSVKEQHRIVQEIETRFSIADNLEKTIDDSLARSRQLRQAILKKAFEGRLVPQDPDDEPASRLLERIKQEKAKLEVKAKSSKKKKRRNV